jgi:hypothetical protein
VHPGLADRLATHRRIAARLQGLTGG